MEIVGTVHLLTVLAVAASIILLLGILSWRLVGHRGLTDEYGNCIDPSSSDYQPDITTSLGVLKKSDVNAEESKQGSRDPVCDV